MGDMTVMADAVSTLRRGGGVGAPCAPGPPGWVFELVDTRSGAPPIAGWQDAGPGLAVRTLAGDRFTLVSVACRGAVELAAGEFEQRTTEAYGRLAAELENRGAEHLVRVWNLIPGILAPLGEVPERYRVFNAGRCAAYERWYRGRDRFDTRVATASGVGHQGGDLVIHGLAAAAPGVAVENPRQIPSYRYSSRYGPRPPCFARATRIDVVSQGSWLLVGGTASICGEETVHREDFDAQADETLENLAAVVAAGLAGDPAGVGVRAELLARYRHLRIYYPRRSDGPRVERLAAARFPRAEVELVPAELCRADLLIEIEGVAGPCEAFSGP